MVEQYTTSRLNGLQKGNTQKGLISNIDKILKANAIKLIHLESFYGKSRKQITKALNNKWNSGKERAIINYIKPLLIHLSKQPTAYEELMKSDRIKEIRLEISKLQTKLDRNKHNEKDDPELVNRMIALQKELSQLVNKSIESTPRTLIQSLFYWDKMIRTNHFTDKQISVIFKLLNDNTTIYNDEKDYILKHLASIRKSIYAPIKTTCNIRNKVLFKSELPEYQIPSSEDQSEFISEFFGSSCDQFDQFEDLSQSDKDLRTFDRSGNIILQPKFDKEFKTDYKHIIEENQMLEAVKRNNSTYGFKEVEYNIPSIIEEHTIEDQSNIYYKNAYRFTHKHNVIIQSEERFALKSITQKSFLESLQPTYSCKSQKDLIKNGGTIYEVLLSYPQMRKAQTITNLKVGKINQLLEKRLALEDQLTNHKFSYDKNLSSLENLEKGFMEKEQLQKSIDRLQKQITVLARSEPYFEVLSQTNVIVPSWRKIALSYGLTTKESIEEEGIIESVMINWLFQTSRSQSRLGLFRESEESYNALKSAIKRKAYIVESLLSEPLENCENFEDLPIKAIKQYYRCKTNLGTNLFTDLGDFIVKSKKIKYDTSIGAKYIDPMDCVHPIYRLPILDKDLSGEFIQDRLIKQIFELSQRKNDLFDGYKHNDQFCFEIDNKVYLKNLDKQFYIDIKLGQIESESIKLRKQWLTNYVKPLEEKITLECKRIKDLDERWEFEEKALSDMMEQAENKSIDWIIQYKSDKINELNSKEFIIFTNKNFMELRQKLIGQLVILQKRLYKLKKHFPKELLEDQTNKGEVDNFRRASANFKSHLNERLVNRTINNSVNGKVHTKITQSLSAIKYNAKVQNYWDNAESLCRIARFYPLGKNASLNHKESIRSMLIYAIAQIREKIYLDIINQRENTIWNKLLDVILQYEDIIEGIPDPNKHLTLQRIPIEELKNFFKAMEIYDIFEYQYKFLAIPLRKKKIVKRIGNMIKRLGINSDKIYAIVNKEAKMYYIAYQTKYEAPISRIVRKVGSIEASDLSF